MSAIRTLTDGPLLAREQSSPSSPFNRLDLCLAKTIMGISGLEFRVHSTLYAHHLPSILPGNGAGNAHLPPTRVAC